MKTKGSCPLCDLQYHKKRRPTNHHVFPRVWYHGIGPLVEVCSDCHQEFNHDYPMRSQWSKEECLQNWSDFCKSKGKWMYQVYPHLKQEGLAHL